MQHRLAAGLERPLEIDDAFHFVRERADHLGIAAHYNDARESTAAGSPTPRKGCRL